MGKVSNIERHTHRSIAKLVTHEIQDFNAVGSNYVILINSGIHRVFEYLKSRF